MRNDSPHSLGTLNERINASREVQDERDRRYESRYQGQQEAVRLAKAAADSAQGKVSVVAAISIIAGVLSAISLMLSLAGKLPH